MKVRIHVQFDPDVLRRLDERVGPRGRSRFLETAARQALDDADRWELVESAMGSISDEGHAWDDDPAEWVAGQRRADASRVG